MNEKPVRRLVDVPIEKPPAVMPQPAPAPESLVQVDGDGWVRIGGILIGRKIERNGETLLQVCDKDKRRSAERGTRFLEVPLVDFVLAMERGEVNLLTSFIPNSY